MRGRSLNHLTKEKGWNPAIYNIRYIKPLDTQLLDDICRQYDRIVTVEDGTVIGGLYGAVSEYVSQRYCSVKVMPIGIPDRYINQGTQKELRQECGLSVSEIKAVVLGECEKI